MGGGRGCRSWVDSRCQWAEPFPLVRPRSQAFLRFRGLLGGVGSPFGTGRTRPVPIREPHSKTPPSWLARSGLLGLSYPRFIRSEISAVNSVVESSPPMSAVQIPSAMAPLMEVFSERPASTSPR